MKILQILPTLAYGDAIGNHTMALRKVIESMGYETQIYAENIGGSLKTKIAVHVSELPELLEDDIILYHLSTESKLNHEIAKLPGRKIIIYHNVTPPEFFKEYDPFIMRNIEWALEDVKYLADKADYCLVDSEFNKIDLINYDYKCRIDVMPILIPFKDYEKKPNMKIINRYSDRCTNIVFTGRIAPNKKQEDVIAAFYYYKKYCDVKARLFLVGSCGTGNLYYKKLKQYVELLDLKDVFFTDHIKFDEILAYYHIADIFLCMSEHEGFCVPLVEAMFFEIPIIAYNSTAVPYTLMGSGLLIDDKDPLVVAKLMDKVLKNETLKKTMIDGQNRRLKDFSYKIIKKQFVGYLENFIGEQR